MGDLTLSEEWLGDGVGGRWEEQKEGSQREMGLVGKNNCLKNKKEIIFFPFLVT